MAVTLAIYKLTQPVPPVIELELPYSDALPKASTHVSHAPWVGVCAQEGGRKTRCEIASRTKGLYNKICQSHKMLVVLLGRGPLCCQSQANSQISRYTDFHALTRTIANWWLSFIRCREEVETPEARQSHVDIKTPERIDGKGRRKSRRRRENRRTRWPSSRRRRHQR